MQRCVIDTKESLHTPPAYAPITLAQAKKQCRLGSSTSEDDQFTDIWIPQATHLFEQLTGIQCYPAAWTYALDAFPFSDTIELPKVPLISVTSVTYVDGDEADQTLADTNYVVSAPQGVNPDRGSISLLPSASWPATSARKKAVSIVYQAGYVDATVSPEAPNVPGIIKGTILQIVAHLYQHRSAVAEARHGQHIELPIGLDLTIQNLASRSTRQPWRWADPSWV